MPNLEEIENRMNQTKNILHKCVLEGQIKIELKDIAKLQHLYIEIFTEEDEDYFDPCLGYNFEEALENIEQYDLREE